MSDYICKASIVAEPALCERCEETEIDCVCATCPVCEHLFYREDAESCSCRIYCSSQCGERDDHYHCEYCGSATDGAVTCSDCGHGECCRHFSCHDCTRCENCCTCSPEEPEGSEYVRTSSCRDYPVSNPTTAPYKPFLFSGVELEIECENNDQLDAVAKDLQVYERRILLKEDGSLDCGFEIVTGKNSLEAQQALWPLVAAVARKSGARSWKHSTTGLHVHLSRNWFTPLTLGKFLVFMNSPATRTPVIRLAGRECPGYAEIQEKKLMDYQGKSKNRYEAVNLTNSATIEVRIFKGTLNTDHILADIEFCYAAANWAAQVSTAQCESWESFWAYVLLRKKEYRHLIAFFGEDFHRANEKDI